MKKGKVVMTENVIDHSKMLFTKILSHEDAEKVLSFLDEAFGKSFNIVFLDMPDCPALKEVTKFAVDKMMFTVYSKKFNEIESGEFPEETFLIIADPTPSGLMATMKARGLDYADLNQDLVILSQNSQRAIDSLSNLGQKIHKVFAAVSEENHQLVFRKIMDYITGDGEAEQFIENAIN